MTKRVIEDYIYDIVDAIDAALQFVEDITFFDFVSDKKTIFASTRSIQIIGEAAKKIPEVVRVQYSDVPWKAMMGMRDKVTHGYFGVNLNVLWDTIRARFTKTKSYTTSYFRRFKTE